MDENKKPKSDDIKPTTAQGRLAHVEAMVFEIHECLVGGNKLKGGKPGLVDVVAGNTKDLENIVPEVEKLKTTLKNLKTFWSLFLASMVTTILVVNFLDSIKSLFK